MSRSIRSYPEEYRKAAVIKRLKGRTGGIGFLAALDAANKYYSKDAKVTGAIPKAKT